MKIVIRRDALRWGLRWGQRAFFAAAISMLAYGGYILIDARVFQENQRRELDRILIQHPASASVKVSRAVATDGLLGRIEIPRLGISVMVIEGTSGKTLRRAVGHIAGTALPGVAGNVGLSGHRDTFFRPLRNIRGNDVIAVTTAAGEFRYRVVATKIVEPTDVTVLGPGEKETLTLVTCYPFYFVGSAPKRFIVRAERVL